MNNLKQIIKIYKAENITDLILWSLERYACWILTEYHHISGYLLRLRLEPEQFHLLIYCNSKFLRSFLPKNDFGNAAKDRDNFEYL